MLKRLFPIMMICGIISCQKNQSIDLSEYYFPVHNDSFQAKYEYESISDPNAPNEIWQYALNIKGDKKYLTGVNFDQKGRPMQINKEEIVGNGSLLKDLAFVDYDSTGTADTLHAAITGNNVFPFEVKDSTDVFYYKVEWKQKPDGTKITLTRNRRYLGQTTFIFNNKEVECARFLLRELLVTETEGQTRTQWNGEELYAKGIGLVYYRKNISPSYTLEYKLIMKF